MDVHINEFEMSSPIYFLKGFFTYILVKEISQILLTFLYIVYFIRQVIYNLDVCHVK